MTQIDTFIERALAPKADATLAWLPAPVEGETTVIDKSPYERGEAPLKNGAVLTDDGLIDGAAALLLDGIDQYGDTGWETRTNICTNPSLEVDATGWSEETTETKNAFERSTLWAKYGTGSLYYKATGKGGAGIAYVKSAKLPIAAGTTYTASVQAQRWKLPADGVVLWVSWWEGGNYLSSAAASAVTTLGASRQELTAVAPANATHVEVSYGCHTAFSVLLENGEVLEVHLDAWKLEAAAEAGTDFPTPTQLESEEAGWSGAAHGSASDIGFFARGVKRSAVLMLNRATNATYDMIFGGPNNIVRVYAVEGNQTVTFQANNFSLPAWAGLLPTAEDTLLIVEWDGATTEVTPYVDAVAAKTENYAAHQQGIGTLLLGNTDSNPARFFAGLMLPGAFYFGHLTADEKLELFDLTAPETTITTHPEEVSTDTTPTFEFESSEEGATFEVRLDGGEWIDVAAAEIYEPTLKKGLHTFEVRATDEAGNVDPTSSVFNWYLDPTIPGAPAPLTTIPKLKVPIQMGETNLAVVEQDSPEEIAASVYALIATERGSRLEDPDYGVEDASFEVFPPDDAIDEWLIQIERYEPRAQVRTRADLEDLVASVTVGVEPRS